MGAVLVGRLHPVHGFPRTRFQALIAVQPGKSQRQVLGKVGLKVMLVQCGLQKPLSLPLHRLFCRIQLLCQPDAFPLRIPVFSVLMFDLPVQFFQPPRSGLIFRPAKKCPQLPGGGTVRLQLHLERTAKPLRGVSLLPFAFNRVLHVLDRPGGIAQLLTLALQLLQ